MKYRNGMFLAPEDGAGNGGGSKIIDPSSVGTIQKELHVIQGEIRSTFENYREELSELKADVSKQEESLSELRSDTLLNLEGQMAELLKQQQEMNARYMAPPVSFDEANRMAKDAQVRAFCKAFRMKAGIGGEPLTEEDKRTLYPDGQSFPLPRDPGDRVQFLSADQARALVEDSTGEILVPEALYSEIQRVAEDAAVIRPLANVMTITSNRMRYRTMGEVSMYYGQKLETGGDAPTKSTLTPAEAYQYIENCYGWLEVGEDELEDADAPLIQYITTSFGIAKRDVEDEKFLGGSGHSSYEPEGLTNGTTIARVVAAGASAVTYEDILDVMYGNESGGSVLKAVYRRNGIFIMHSWTELACLKIEDDDGRPLWHPAMQPGMPNTLYGKRVFTLDDMSQIGTGNDIMVFGDLRSGYRIIDRVGMSLRRLDELKIESGLVVFRSRMRNTGGIYRAAALRILQNA